MTLFDIWNTQYDIVNSVYCSNNYKILENEDNSENSCIIFFSSNNIWNPHTKDAFIRSFINNDYFEWKNFSDINFKKIIFVRDIYKSWYVTGINKNLNNIDKVVEFLKSETFNMDVVTVGSSAGGYMAVLVASLLNAKYSLCFSAQFDLYTDGAIATNPFLHKYSKDMHKNKYFRLNQIIENSTTKIFYILPVHCKSDRTQMKNIEGIKNINILKIASKSHGIPILKANLNKLVKMNEKEIDILFSELSTKIVNPLVFSVFIEGVRNSFIAVILEVKRKIKSKIDVTIHSLIK